MKKAIITGSTGLVGMAVARHFASIGMEVLCIGRQKLTSDDIIRNFGEGARYIQLSMAEISSLQDQVNLINWSPGAECVFFNFAWRGQERLTDGSFEDQLINAVYAVEALRTAKKLGCIKFVNAGTLEETLVERFLSEGSKQPYHSPQTDYALAKLASRDMCKIIAYLAKIDYVHTRLSVPLSPDLSRGTYVASTLKKIAEGKPYDGPKNNQLLDIIFIDDVARAYYLIGVRGKNKADYFIGTSRPATLAQYFEMFERLMNRNRSDKPDIGKSKELINDIFNTKALFEDTGFVARTQFEALLKQSQNL